MPLNIQIAIMDPQRELLPSCLPSRWHHPQRLLGTGFRTLKYSVIGYWVYYWKDNFGYSQLDIGSKWFVLADSLCWQRSESQTRLHCDWANQRHCIPYLILNPQFEFIHKQHGSLKRWFQSYVTVALLWTTYVGLYILEQEAPLQQAFWTLALLIFCAEWLFSVRKLSCAL